MTVRRHYLDRVLEGLDLDAVGRWLEDNVDGAVGPFDATLIGGGRSNLTFAVDRRRRPAVRRAPPAARPRAGDGPRHGPRAPHHRRPRPDRRARCRRRSACAPTTDVNGAPFYVMGYVDGVVLDSPDKADAPRRAGARGKASDDLIDVLADLHDVDVDAVGLGDLARREGYIERQLKRWTTQWANSKTRELPAIDEVAERLAARIPPQHGVVDRPRRLPVRQLPHRSRRSGRIAAVLDWELCTLGDPLADVGYLGVYWTDPGGTRRPPQRSVGRRRASRRTPSCSSATPRAPAATSPGIDYYVAFASWRLAVIGEGVYARYLHGAMGDQGIGPDELDAFKAGTEQLAGAALEAARRLA